MRGKQRIFTSWVGAGFAKTIFAHSVVLSGNHASRSWHCPSGSVRSISQALCAWHWEALCHVPWSRSTYGADSASTGSRGVTWCTQRAGYPAQKRQTTMRR